MPFSELLLIAFVALLVFGPRRLPRLAQDLGRWVGRARRAFAALKFEMTSPLREQQLKDNKAKADAAERRHD